MNINGTIWAYDSYWDTFAQAEMAEDFKIVYGYEPSEEELNEHCDRQAEIDFETILDEIDYHEKVNGQKTYIVVARIGTWRGIFDGGKVLTGMRDVFSQCSADYSTYYFKNSQMRITAHHHDGTNTFIVRELTPKGIEFMENHEGDFTDRELHQKLFKSSRYSRMVSLFPNLYGWR